jgi:hypothetical protein
MDFEYTLLRESKVHVFGLSWRQEQQAAQYLTGIKADYAKLGADFFIRVNNLEGLIKHLSQ